MKLTAQQEKFAQALADGMTQADAYRTAYNASKMQDSTIYEKASRMLKEGKISARVASLKEALATKALWTREKSVRGLANIADGDEARAAEIIAAIKELNSMHGFNAPAKLDVTGTTVTRIELVAMSDDRAS